MKFNANKFIKTKYVPSNCKLQQINIINPENNPHDFQITRILFNEGSFILPSLGCIIAIIEGSVLVSYKNTDYHLETNTFMFLPASIEGKMISKGIAKVILIAAKNTTQTRGTKIIIRNLSILKANSHRWILTSQYLSRRVFLYHDQTLVSRTGYPITITLTTVFSSEGLKENNQGLPVFRMQYDNHFETNVMVEVKGISKVRYAIKPYFDDESLQRWEEWNDLDDMTCYNLYESEQEEERDDNCSLNIDEKSKENVKCRGRNKHEIYADEEHTNLCIFDPALTGDEKHQEGLYSSYRKLEESISDESYLQFLSSITPIDNLTDELSLMESLKQDISTHLSYRTFLNLLMQIQSNNLKILAQSKNQSKDISKDRSNLIDKYI